MDLKSMTPVEAATAVEAETDIEVIRASAKSIDIAFSGNSGIDTIKGKILESLAAKAAEGDEPVGAPEAPVTEAPSVIDAADDEPIEVAKAIPAGPSTEELLQMDPKEVKDPGTRRKVVRAHALKLVRVNIVNLDAAEAQLDSVLVTALNKYTGKVSRVVPFGLDWHVEAILLNDMKNKKFVMRKEKKGPNQKFGVKEYDTFYAPKYNITVLPDLTKAELAELASAQRASGSIDKPA